MQKKDDVCRCLKFHWTLSRNFVDMVDQGRHFCELRIFEGVAISRKTIAVISFGLVVNIGRVQASVSSERPKEIEVGYGISDGIVLVNIGLIRGISYSRIRGRLDGGCEDFFIG